MSDQANAAAAFAVPMRARSAVLGMPEVTKPKRKCLPAGQATTRIEAVGRETILQRIVAGETLTEIANSVRVPMSTLAMYLTADHSVEAYARARYLSADAWLDRGLKYLTEAAGSPAEVNRARALEQHCAKQAAIRNPRYSERSQVELSGPDGGPIQSQVQIAVYLPQNGRVTLDK